MPHHLIDSNAFEFLADKNRYEAFLQAASSSQNKKAKEFAASLKEGYIVRNHSSILEYSWLSQKPLHKKLEVIISSIHPQIKGTLDPFVKDFEASKQDQVAIDKLTKGFDKAWTMLTGYCIEHLNTDSDLSRGKTLERMEKRKNSYPEISPVFLNEFNYVKYNLSGNQWKRLLESIAIEAVSRYCIKLMLKIYPGNLNLSRLWENHITATYFHFWKEEKRNESTYRIIGDCLDFLNRKYQPSFFPAKKLRPHDDTVDGYLVHGLSMGWFYKRELVPIFAFTEDPIDEVISRVQQYQAVLAYYQNPLGNQIGAVPRVDNVRPGTLFRLDREKKLLQIVTFETPEVKQSSNGEPVVTTRRSDMENIILSF